MKRHMREELLHHRLPMNKELRSLRAVCDIAEFCNFNEICRMGAAHLAQIFIGQRQEYIIRLKDPQIENIGKIINILIAIVEKMPIALFIFSHALPCRMVCRSICRKQHDDRLHVIVRCECIIYGRLFIPNKVVLHKKDNPHPALRMRTVVKFLKVICRCVHVGK